MRFRLQTWCPRRIHSRCSNAARLWAADKCSFRLIGCIHAVLSSFRTGTDYCPSTPSQMRHDACQARYTGRVQSIAAAGCPALRTAINGSPVRPLWAPRAIIDLPVALSLRNKRPRSEVGPRSVIELEEYWHSGPTVRFPASLKTQGEIGDAALVSLYRIENCTTPCACAKSFRTQLARIA